MIGISTQKTKFLAISSVKRNSLHFAPSFNVTHNRYLIPEHPIECRLARPRRLRDCSTESSQIHWYQQV